MKQLRNFINIRKGKSTIKAEDRTIRKIVQDELNSLGHNADLNHIDVSEVTFMFNLFSCAPLYLGPRYKDLNPNITEWDVSNVIDMRWMFYDCKNFNQDISKWNVSKVEDMHYMFYNCENFNQDISRWNVSNVKFESGMFDNCPIKEEYKPHFVK